MAHPKLLMHSMAQKQAVWLNDKRLIFPTLELTLVCTIVSVNVWNLSKSNVLSYSLLDQAMSQLNIM